MTQSTEDGFEFDAAELAGRPQTIVAIYGGPTWRVLETYDEVAAAIEDAVGDGRIVLMSHQDEGLPPARIQVNPNLVSTVFEITEDRWKADRIERHNQEQAMREQAARGGLVQPPGGLGGGLN